MAVDFHKAFEKLHEYEPNIEVSFFGPGGEQAEAQWGPTVGRKPGSAEDFDNLLIAFARHLGFTGTNDAARAWVLGQLKDYLVKDRSQRIGRYETLHEAPWEIVERARATGTDPETGFRWKSELLVIREAAKAAANFVLANPEPERVAGEPEKVSSALPDRAQTRPRRLSQPTETMKYRARLYGYLKSAGALKPDNGLPRLDLDALTAVARVLDEMKFPFPPKWSTEGWDKPTWSDGALYDNRDAFEALLDSGSRRHLRDRDRYPELISFESRIVESQTNSAHRKKRKTTATSTS
jgi:hypothetical protein